MTQNDAINKSHEMAKEWFVNHKAKCHVAHADGKITIIEWRRPDHGNYAMRYIISTNYIIVTGDVGDAIYAFGKVLEVKDIMRFDWHYFWGKCVASETGRRYEMKCAGVKTPVPNVRAIAHFIGLQMAITQLINDAVFAPL